MITFNVLIETNKGSNMKYEYDTKSDDSLKQDSGKKFRLDRILHGSNVYPGDYGFIEKTLALDNDPIDVLVWISQPTFPGCIVKVKIIGGLEMIDGGEIDNKLLGVCVNDPEFQHFNSLEEIPTKWKEKVHECFQNYKNLEKKVIILKNWINQKKAIQFIWDSQKHWINYRIENNIGDIESWYQKLKYLKENIKKQKKELENISKKGNSKKGRQK